MTVSELMLTLELENAETGERWSGEFTAQCRSHLSYASMSSCMILALLTCGNGLHLYTYILTYLYTYIPTYLHTYIPTYLYTYIPIHLHTYIPTYLYTSDIEEISHKAGNLKKFSVFTKMLSSSFSKDNESVFVDILTFTDLELLKARKTGAKPSSSTAPSASNGRQYQKRYVILTYSAEFDRVHYPLPLAFEETPNVPALRRNIARLRRQLQDKSNQEALPANDKEK
jgi:hypothetical protein